jgi:hypothetical protein
MAKEKASYRSDDQRRDNLQVQHNSVVDQLSMFEDGGPTLVATLVEALGNLPVT